MRPAAPERPQRPVLVFDGDCGLCRRSVQWLQSRTGERLELLPYQELAGRLPQVDRAACATAVQFVGRDGRVAAGAAGVVRALALVPGHGLPSWLYRWLPGARPVLDSAYRLVAANRGRLAGWFTRIAGADVEPPTFTVGRRLFLLWLALLTAVAFVSLAAQYGLLFGPHGIRPLADTMATARDEGTRPLQMPTLFWWLDAASGRLVLLAGTVAALLLAAGVLQRLALLVALVCWLSFIQVGHEFLQSDGDAMLLEVLGLALLLAPRGLLRPAHGHAPLPVTRWLLLLLCLRICVGTAWQRLAGQVAVADVLHDQLLTQPLPSALGLWCARWPGWLLASLSWLDVLAELLLPWLLFAPRRLRHFAAASLAVVQLGWLATGTQGLAPLLVLGLLLLAVDDRGWRPLLPRRWLPDGSAGAPEPRRLRTVVQGGLAALLLAAWTWQAFAAAASPAAALLDRFGIGRGYDEFGFVAAERPQLLLQGSANGSSWYPYGTAWLPADAGQAPAYSIGHLPRLDWQLAFAAHAAAAGVVPPWLEWLALRLLQNRTAVRGPFAGRPFGDEAPSAVRLMLYRCLPPSPSAWREGSWWVREPLGAVGRPYRLGG